MPQYKLPKICARCGLHQGTCFWKITNGVARLDLLSIISIWFGYIVFQQGKYFFSVPLCGSCRILMEKTQEASSRAKRIGVILGIIALVLISIIYKSENAQGRIFIVAPVFGGLIGFVLGSIFGGIIKLSKNIHIGSYDGKYFYFKNQEFHRQFTTLNPELVKK